MDKEEQRPQPGEGTTHPPLPYLVRLRLTMTDDSRPEIVEYRVVAYSLREATMQACFQAGAVAFEGQNVTVEFVGPDLDAYARVFGVPAVARLASALRPGTEATKT